MMGAVFTAKEIRELIERMERTAIVCEEYESVRKANGFRESAQMLKDLLEEHGL
jgi:hypothetical protein